MSGLWTRAAAILRRVAGAVGQSDLREQSRQLVEAVAAESVATRVPVPVERPVAGRAMRKPNLLACQLASTQRLNVPSARGRSKSKSGIGNRPKAIDAKAAVKRSPSRKVVWLSAKTVTPVERGPNVLEFPARPRKPVSQRTSKSLNVAA